MHKMICAEQHVVVDGETGAITCTAPQWVPDASIFPAINVSDAFALAGAVAVLWAVAWVWKQIGRVQ